MGSVKQNVFSRLLLGFFFLIMLVVPVSAQGCFLYLESDYYCQEVDLFSVQEECSFLEDCSLSQHYQSGKSCAKFRQCELVLCRSSCQEEFLGRCSAGEVPIGQEDSWCQASCCRFSYNSNTYCQIEETKWYCELAAQNRNQELINWDSSLLADSCKTSCQVPYLTEKVSPKPSFDPQVELSGISPSSVESVIPNEFSTTVSQTSQILETTNNASSNNLVLLLILLISLLLIGFLLFVLSRNLLFRVTAFTFRKKKSGLTPTPLASTNSKLSTDGSKTHGTFKLSDPRGVTPLMFTGVSNSHTHQKQRELESQELFEEFPSSEREISVFEQVRKMFRAQVRKSSKLQKHTKKQSIGGNPFARLEKLANPKNK